VYFSDPALNPADPDVSPVREVQGGQLLPALQERSEHRGPGRSGGRDLGGLILSR